MTRVLASAEAEALAVEQERDREAWNLPRRPVGAQVRAKDHASPDLKEAAARDEPAAAPSRMKVPALDIHRTNRATGQDTLDWESFLAAHFPGSRRHDLKVLTAYAAHRRSRAVDGQSATRIVPVKTADRISTGATAVEAWEDEGGTSL